MNRDFRSWHGTDKPMRSPHVCCRGVDGTYLKGGARSENLPSQTLMCRRSLRREDDPPGPLGESRCLARQIAIPTVYGAKIKTEASLPPFSILRSNQDLIPAVPPHARAAYRPARSPR